MARRRFPGSGGRSRSGESGKPAGRAPYPANSASGKRFTRGGDRRPSESTPRSSSESGHTRPHRPPVSPDIDLIYGFHAVREALRSPRRKLLRLWATADAAERLATEIGARALAPEIVDAEEIDRRLSGTEAVHQGLLLEARPLATIEIADLPAEGLVLVLDQITDPHNVGAILRTAAAFGVDALITTERHSPAFSGILAKSASGGLEHVGLVRVVNLARALEQLADRDYLRIGLDSNGPISFEEAPLRRPLALVLGAEGRGLRRLTRDNCDVLARLDMPGKVRSLNVSNACAVALTIIRLRLSA